MDINGEKHIIKSDELLKYFEIIMEKQKHNPIVKVYNKYYDYPDNTEKLMYDLDTEFYILFENQYALIIDYRNIDSLYVEYKQLSKEELEEAANIGCKDFFNRTDEVYDHNTIKLLTRRNSIFEYGCIRDIKYDKVNRNYEVWENSDIIEQTPTEWTFNEIVLILDNENEIHICPEPALSDGYVDIWCKGAKINIQEYSD